MEKNWLIRTQQNQILGPISKERLKDFINKGTINLADEICSGNGYWFFLREEELVKKYIDGDEIQLFNPISEAEKGIIISEIFRTEKKKELKERNLNKKFSLEDDSGPKLKLEPEPELEVEVEVDKAAIKDCDEIQKKLKKIKIPHEVIENDAPEICQEAESSIKKSEEEKVEIIAEEIHRENYREEENPSSLKKYLLIGFILIGIILGLLYYFKIFNKSPVTTFLFINDALAQRDELSMVKKKS